MIVRPEQLKSIDASTITFSVLPAAYNTLRCCISPAPRRVVVENDNLDAQGKSNPRIAANSLVFVCQQSSWAHLVRHYCAVPISKPVRMHRLPLKKNTCLLGWFWEEALSNSNIHIQPSAPILSRCTHIAGARSHKLRHRLDLVSCNVPKARPCAGQTMLDGISSPIAGTTMIYPIPSANKR